MTATATKFETYRLKVGSHVEPVRDEEGNIKTNESGKKQKIFHRANDIKLCMVKSPTDLVETYGSQKFEKVLTAEDHIPIEESNPEVLNLPQMTVVKLREYAEDNEIDLEGFTKKADIIDVIRESIAG
tara:strand:+ start:22273 stop:22656 length:384 start_codon:yes stop_codon:yes gene_type:complete